MENVNKPGFCIKTECEILVRIDKFIPNIGKKSIFCQVI